MINTLFPEHFPALALAHFVALLSPGPDFFLISAYAIRFRLCGSVGICVGIALGNALYIVLAALGWTGLQQSYGWFQLVEVAGALYLLWIGFHLMRSKGKVDLPRGNTSSRCPGLLRQLALGLGSALLNPKNMLFYLSLMTTLLGAQATRLQQAVSGTWMVLVVLVWDLSIAMLIARPALQRRLAGSIGWLERGAGIVLFGLGGYLLLR
ncbi:threonine transporter RhtB [Lonsdalea britannica]|uniref:LysE family translocator n=1 Tax=Lonsdalea britannica TaxID=1082704 RepID=UPI000A1ED108|nr:LysE family translocator [Lonsdalea britannica]OSN08403.1 threonine transporter RhtB [Lonsdalea britannica]